jgi:aminopeptidase N
MKSAFFAISLILFLFSAANGRLPGKTSPVHFPHQNQRPYDVQHYKIALRCDPTEQTITGSTSITLRARETISSIELDFTGLTVSHIRQQPDIGSDLEYYRNSGLLTINLPVPLNTDELTEITIDYLGAPEAGLYFRENDRGEIIIYSHNEPFDARYWFPCNDTPADKANTWMQITVPPEYSVLSNGTLHATTTDSVGWKTYNWMEAYPITTYLISLAAGPYVIIDYPVFFSDSSMPLHYYVYPDNQNMGLAALENTAGMVLYFSTYIGRYPFSLEKYAMCEVPFREAGAMENQTATTMGDFLADNESVIAHELAHQWFGDAISPESFADIWLNEGFASYFDALFFGHKYGPETFAVRMENFRSAISADGSMDYPIYAPPPQYLFGRAVYYKGAWVLHMLRLLIGDSAFQQSIQMYYHNFRYGNASTTDLVEICQTVSGMDLGYFFEQWLMRPGLPQLEVYWTQSNGLLDIDILQTQETARYRIDIDLLLEGVTRDSTITVPLSAARHHFSIPYSAAVSRISVDPDGRVLQSNNGPVFRIPEATTLVNLYPNPARGQLNIVYQVFHPAVVHIEIFNPAGQKLTTLDAGYHSTGLYHSSWTATDMPSGLYFIRLVSGNERHTAKAILMK